ncbi:4Fe-4S dicluster domain-containing protein [Filimonas lacunae]|uniref:4Fe-4S dicluster domain-containing protein n=1 Tax=Filimonas lacunae TaxID=477680 RepID=A0A173MJ60_9BACT|nr:4Fe-4S dicluster domain-containing protein [Filimonas lacunae]BAV07530.1 iron-sulphur-binding reductase [Filimonas lacunae]SIT30060.1 4Fe-4S dicluster domain-containing protein [Filimonas lacunae]
MHIIQEAAFIVVLAVAGYLFSKKARQIYRNIMLGRPEALTDEPEKRWRNLLLLAFGQKKMFRNPLVAVLHFIVYAGFIIINLEVLEILLDGILGKHRLFAEPLGGFYTFLINSFELLAAGVLIACSIFLVRRNIVKVKRLNSKDLTGWPKSDANYILITEIVLMSLFLTMNAADTLLQQRGYSHYGEAVTGNFWVSSILQPLFAGFSSGALEGLERTCWWLHILGILAFLNYLPYSKHLHIVLAFPNAYFARLKPMGRMKNMPDIQKEVLYAMQPELAPTEPAEPHRFGARDVMDLSWKNVLDAYSCTECGRCTAACPANITGKKLSPRKIMMDTRDRAEEIGENINKNGQFTDDGKSLVRDYITEEELRACTTCNACVQECPVSISPLDIILQLRRYLVMEESSAPAEWNGMFSNIENNFAPWKFSPDDRDKWVTEN